jgi:hypothetical protein
VQTSRHAALGACQARATSGVPPNEELWVADVCARRRAVDEAMLPMRGEEAGGFVNAHGPGAAGLTFAPPAFMPVPRADGSYSHLRGQHGIIGVLSSDGVVTAISSHGARLWQVRARRLLTLLDGCCGSMCGWGQRGLRLPPLGRCDLPCVCRRQWLLA